MNRFDVRKALVWLGAAWAALVVWSSAGEVRADASSDLEKAHSAYVAHKYEDAEKRLRALLDPQTGTLTDPDAVADARMYLGAVLLAEGKKDEAAQVFETLLLDRPDYQPDPLRVSLQSIDALIDARTRLRDRLEVIQAEKVRRAQAERARIEASRQRAAERQALIETLASEEMVIQRNSRWIAMVPFGAAQFQNRQTALAWMFLSSEALFAVGSIVGGAAWVYNVNQFDSAFTGNDESAARQYHARAQSAFIVGDVFAGAFAFTAIAGIVHGQLTFVPQFVETRKRPLPPFSFAPTLGPAGLGISGTF
jgi:tetratricopeptide (TPR) repeat protein